MCGRFDASKAGKDLSAQERLTITRILKVNHAGEYGAIRIYSAQIFVSSRLHKHLIPFLRDILTHEIRHCRQFHEAMPARLARPCRAMSLWSLGGYLLGLLTALMGENAIMACTKAVEQSVHRHLHDQLRFLKGRDDALHDLIALIQIDEDAHLSWAKARLRPSLAARMLETLVAVATESVIGLSTQGDVGRMVRALREG
jgi:ubiquinone biosynthesis monooxygenase Coq7